MVNIERETEHEKVKVENDRGGGKRKLHEMERS